MASYSIWQFQLFPCIRLNAKTISVLAKQAYEIQICAGGGLKKEINNPNKTFRARLLITTFRLSDILMRTHSFYLRCLTNLISLQKFRSNAVLGFASN